MILKASHVTTKSGLAVTIVLSAIWKISHGIGEKWDFHSIPNL